MGYIYKKKSLKMTTVQVVFDAGAVYEKEGQRGTMHLMEHLICKNFDDMQSELTKNAISWNAYTGDEHVVFHFTGLSDYLTPELKRTLVSKIISDFAPNVSKEFDTEKNTVLQEYADYFNSPSGKILNFMRSRYGYYDAIGLKSDIEKFTYEDACNRKEEFFRKPARIIEVGPVKTDFSDIEYSEECRERFKLKFKKKDSGAEMEKTPDSDKVQFYCVGKMNIKKSDFSALKIGTMMLCSGLESIFYKEIRVKRGLSYYSRGDVTPICDQAFLAFSACTTNENVDSLESVYKELFNNSKDYLTEERYNDIVNELKIAKKKSEILKYSYVGKEVRGKWLKITNNIDSIKFEKVKEVVSKYINNENIEIFKLK